MEKNIINRRTKRIIENALKEDIGNGDITTDILFENISIIKEAEIIAKADEIVSGVSVVKEVFRQVDKKVKVENFVEDGDRVKKGDIIFKFVGEASSILRAERVSLNFLGHMSGIATLTDKIVSALDSKKTKILDTRKTLPTLREFQKYAVTCGRGVNHRYNLNDMAMIKENHIEGVGGISKALKMLKTDDRLGKRKVELEIEYPHQLEECLEYSPDVIMLDEMNDEDFTKSIEFIRKNLPETKIEISGGVTLENISRFRQFDIDFISIGAITHSVIQADFSLLIR